MSSSSLPTIRLPNMLDNWPWPRTLHSQYESLRADSAAWLSQYKSESLGVQKVFAGGNSESLLASLVWPDVDYESLRAGCDLISSVIITDDCLDVETGSSAEAIIDAILHAFHHPEVPTPASAPIAAEITRQAWTRAMKLGSPSQRRRFIQKYGDFLRAITKEAEDRDTEYVRDIEEYMQVRRDTIASRPAFWVVECLSGIPEHIADHPSILKLSEYATELIIITNDVVSYNKEQAQGSIHNLVAIAMLSLNLTVQEAMDWTGALFESIVQKFLAALNKVPSWGPDIDSKVAVYIDGLGNWVRGHEVWSFECLRYFGKKGKDIRNSRLVTLLPPRSVTGRADAQLPPPLVTSPPAATVC
ncbi:terpenoid synthase [Sistotremastrum niveocremeum HHB9708]|uniref:Terpene synthase n=1 Tax=Sistotremastrum niveocremeum HHB9708 TaxID=1314777 RepID=A0A164T7F6_9AGAM|nr:terpenoid synthase [Sistotremastrum niveocremeum HHB9708]